MGKEVVVYSLDMDGCLFAPRDTRLPEEMYDENTSLMAEIQKDPRRKYVCSFSARQNRRFDQALSTQNRTPLATDMVAYIAKKTGSILNKFMLNDLVGQNMSSKPRLPGEEFDSAFSSHGYENFICDELKILLVYAQVHNLAVHENGAESIIFRFFDDFDEEEDKPILRALYIFYSTYPNFIPKHVTLKFSLYHSHMSPIDYKPDKYIVQGTGETHSCYYDVTRAIARDYLILSYEASRVDCTKMSENMDVLIAMGIGSADNASFRHDPGVGLNSRYFDAATDAAFFYLWQTEIGHLGPEIFQSNSNALRK